MPTATGAPANVSMRRNMRLLTMGDTSCMTGDEGGGEGRERMRGGGDAARKSAGRAPASPVSMARKASAWASASLRDS